LVYLLSVVLLGMFTGRGPTLVAATLTALLWNFLVRAAALHVPHQRRHGLMLFFTYLSCAPMGSLARGCVAQQAAERRRSSGHRALLLTRELANASDFADLLAIVVREVGK